MSGGKWIPTPQQFEALSWIVREELYGGARGGGKSDAGIVWVSKPALRKKWKKFRGLVLRENAVDLSDWLDRAGWMLSGTGAKVTGNTVRWPTGEKLVCGHLKDPRSIRKWLGREFQRILIEELTQIPNERLYEELLGSCRSSIPGLDARLFATTNPGGPGHGWVKKRFVEKPWGIPFQGKSIDGLDTGSRIFIPAKVTDNPHLMANDPDYVRYLDTLPPDLRAAWRDGSWEMMAGQYFPEFRREKHVCRPFEIPPHWKRYRAMDWGYSPDPHLILWFAVDEKGHEVCYRESQGNRMLPTSVAEKILQLSEKDGKFHAPMVAGVDAWAKDDGPSTAEKIERAGVVMQQAHMDRKNGWMRVHEYLAVNPATGKPWLQIFDTCTELIRCLPALIHSETDPMDCAHNSDIDHAPDALRYHLMSRPSRGILADKIPGPRSLKALRYRKRMEENDA